MEVSPVNMCIHTHLKVPYRLSRRRTGIRPNLFHAFGVCPCSLVNVLPSLQSFLNHLKQFEACGARSRRLC